ncbi:VOC family protein [soil metagenome]
MPNSTRPTTLGLRHIALCVNNLEACEHFYTEIVGMRIEWKPDADNVYLTSGSDNLALHRTTENFQAGTAQRLDHMGFIIKTPELVDQWHDFLIANKVKIKNPPKTHRDGARSLYCLDPEDNLVQFIYHPPLA